MTKFKLGDFGIEIIPWLIFHPHKARKDRYFGIKILLYIFQNLVFSLHEIEYVTVLTPFKYMCHDKKMSSKHKLRNILLE